MKTMTKIIRQVFLVLSSLTFSILVLIVIILFSARILTREKADLIAAVLRNDITRDTLKAASARPAEEKLSPADYRRKIQQEMELRELALNRKEEQMARMAADIEIQRKGVEEREAELDRMQRAFLSQQHQQKKAASEAGFKKAVAHLEGLEAASAAETIYQFQEEEIVRYLKAFDDDYASEVIEAMKNTEKRTTGAPATGTMSRIGRIVRLYYEETNSSE